MGTDRQGVGCQGVASLVHNVNHWRLGTVLGFDDDLILQARSVVGLYLVGIALDDVLELNHTLLLGNDDGVEWVPLGDDIALLDLSTRSKEEHGTVADDGLLQDDTGVGILDTHFGHTADNYLVDRAILLWSIDGTKFLDDEVTIVTSLQVGNSHCIRSNTTGVEGTKCQLCTRLTD